MNADMGMGTDQRPEGQGGAGRVQVAVVTGFDGLQQALAVRAAVFMGEHATPYGREFDGNDLTGTHILATVDGEPAGAMRIRYFGDFAMPERLAVLPKFRAPAFAGNVALKLARQTFRFLGRKGFTRFYGRSLRDVLPFWTLFGAEPMEDGVFRIGGYECVAIAGVRKRPVDALTLHSGHLLLMRPEGQWDRPGVHDRAAGVAAPES
ncbi:hypothetical protein [Azospirillum sp.]|uniref:hypothetical protein n=1 Tax=Azospirillum sp. TaxID=34012 RepID=UPI002D5348A6|nr:hypothetical protein [Azospirillum sp.]HYD70730.1 hypothetical protein [Azospirillum sp.]